MCTTATPELYLGRTPDIVALGYRALPSTAYAFAVLLDNVKIYNHSLSVAEMLTLFTGHR
jgi:hypothetical protein